MVLDPQVSLLLPCPPDEVKIESLLLSRQLGVDETIILERVTCSRS